MRFLAYVDLLGTTYSASTLATGYGSYIAQPLLRKAVEGKEDVLTEEDAQKIIEDSMRVLFYRDARSLNKVLDSPNSTRLYTDRDRIRSSKLLLSLPRASPSRIRGCSRLNGHSLKAFGAMALRHNDVLAVLYTNVNHCFPYCSDWRADVTGDIREHDMCTPRRFACSP
jgi:hypothetical protein